MFEIARTTGALNTLWLSASLLLVLVCAGATSAQTTSFTYQGRLTDGGTAGNGNYDLQFTLWDALSGGTQQPQPTPVTVTRTSVLVTGGIFTVQLDFGAGAFPGANRFLEISARLAGGPSFTTLSPRQQITSTPYAIRSLNASSADAVTVNGVPGGSGNYVQNSTTQQAGANFNISGNGTAGGTISSNVVSATKQYNIGFTPILTVPFNTNLFVGASAGAATTEGPSGLGGYHNSFFGYLAGLNHTIGGNNSIFGAYTGSNLTTGTDNTLVGVYADVGTNPLRNATAIGARARVDQSDSMVLGSIAGVNGETITVKVGIGTTTPQATLDVGGAAVFRPAGVGSVREVSLGSPNGETGIGIKGVNNRADMRFDGQTLRLVAGVGTGPPPSSNGVAIDTAGNVAIGQLSSSASSIHVCLDFLNRLSFCTSSLRYKEQVTPYSAGLDLIRRLHPISFTWKGIGKRDVGLGAEDVAKVEPLLVTHNDKGEIQGVKYDQLNVVLINAIKQQQDQIETLRAENDALNARLRSVERLVRRRVGVSRHRH